MLTMFKCRKTYHDLSVTILVDLENKDVSGTIVYDRRILRMFDAKDAPLWQVDTPEKANAWLSRPLGERGSFIETLEWEARTGILQAQFLQAA